MRSELHLRKFFPLATQLLCQFHVLAAVDRRLKIAKLGDDEREEIFQQFRKAVYAQSEDDLAEAAGYLTSLGIVDEHS